MVQRHLRLGAWLAVAALGFGSWASSALSLDDHQPLVDVVLDPGHSVVDVGAVGGGWAEYRLTLEVARQVQALLEADGLTVRLTRVDHAPLSSFRHPDPIERIRLEQEARIAAGGPTRAYVSLHFNAHPASWLRGTETYFNPERAALSLEEDQRLAAAIQRHVVAALSEAGYETIDRGVKSDLLAGKPYGHFFSLRGDAPSALLEALFLSNPTEAEWAARESVRGAIARGCAQGILEYLADLRASEAA